MCTIGNHGLMLKVIISIIALEIARAKELSVEPSVMAAAWAKNLEVRHHRDWEKMAGRAVV